MKKTLNYYYLANHSSKWHKLIFTMKITVFLLFSGMITLIANPSYSQKSEISLEMLNASVESVLNTIEETSDYYFLFNHKLIDVERKVDINVKKEPIKNILEDIFEEDVKIIVSGRQIVLTPSYGSSNLESLLQQQIVTGQIVDNETQEPMAGVNVVIKGSNVGTVTDAEGKYSLPVSDRNAILVFSFIGYIQQEIPFDGRMIYDVSLSTELTGLDEVIVIGYGSQKKVNLTGAIGIATSENIEKRPVVSVGNALQGIIPNLNITITNGDPLIGAVFNVRGFESINGGSPLILVDGVPMVMERINPNDIESISVLKDAAASAIYGARAAFGVVLITTKHGKQGKMNITFGSEHSLSKPIFLMDVLKDPYECVLAWNQANIRAFGIPMYDDNYVEGTKKWSENPTDENAWGVYDGQLRFYGNNDYQNKMIADFSPQHKYDISISGASDKASYYVSFGYLDKDGYLRNKEKNENYKRYNILMKTDFKLFDWLTIDEKIVWNSRRNDRPHYYSWDVNINSAARVSPIQAIQFPDLEYYITPGDKQKYQRYIGMYFEGTNFFPYLQFGGRNKLAENEIWLSQGITLSPLKGLKIRGEYSKNMFYHRTKDVASKIEVVSSNLTMTPMINYGYSADDYINMFDAYNTSSVLNAYAEYTLDNIDNHYLKGMLGYNQEEQTYENLTGQAKQLITPNVPDINATTGQQIASGGAGAYALRGLFFRLNYNYKEKYLLEINGRYDGSSRFPKNDRWGFFPSVSLGWRITKEEFLSGTKGWLDNLKLRISYGELGNQVLGSNWYPYIASMYPRTTPTYIMSSGLLSVISPAGLVSSTLTWESVNSSNIGLDILMLQSRLEIGLDLYLRDTKDMLMRVDYPDIIGAASPQSNAADLRTKGWELTAKWSDKIGLDWHYGISLGLSDNTSEITKYDNPTGSLSEYRVGQKLGEIWGYVTEGIFQTNDEITNHADQSAIGSNWRLGDMKYANLNEDTMINAGSYTIDDPGDLAIIGNTTARYSFGINPYIGYKNISLNFFLQGLFRDYLPSNQNWVSFYPFNSGEIQNYFMSESWSEDNPNAYFAAPEVTYSGLQKNIVPQSRFVQNAAYIRLKSLVLNYNLPKSLLNRIGLDDISIYVAGDNLWEYSKMHKPLYPEQTNEIQSYYFQRLYTLGIKLMF